MSEPARGLGPLIQELKRRRVFRAAGVYAVVGWALIQVADVVFPALEMPAWSLRLVVLLVLLGFPIALVLAWAFDLTPQGVKRAGAGDGGAARGVGLRYAVAALGLLLLGVVAYTRYAPTRAESADLRSIAVLPFDNMSGDEENEYFSDGLSEELLNALARVPGLDVAARTSSFAYKGKHENITTIAKDLGVATVLEGSVRKSGDKVRITAQLIKADDGYHLWSKTYDRELNDIFSIQEEIARSIVDALKLTLAGGDTRIVRQGTGEPVAYDLYLRGRYALAASRSEPGLRQAVDLFQQAIGRDPSYALAYAGLADAYIALERFVPHDQVSPLARAAALKAIELDDSRAETHTALGHVTMHYDWDWQATERAYRRAAEVDPSSVEAYGSLAHYLVAAGRYEEGLAASRRAVDLARRQTADPAAFEVDAAARISHALFAARRFEEAVAEARRALALNPHHGGAHHSLAMALLGKGDFAAAIPELEGMGHHGRPDPALLGYAYARAGRGADAQRLLSELESKAATEHVRNEDLALLHLGLGREDRAIEALERAYQQRDAGLLHLRMNPLFDPLWKEPRFLELMRKAGVPE